MDKGDDVTLKCEAEGNPPPVFHWTSDGVNITETSSELNITGVNVDSNYTCTATNRLGSITKHIHVYVREAIMRAAPAAMTTPEASTPRGMHPYALNISFRYGKCITNIYCAPK